MPKHYKIEYAIIVVSTLFIIVLVWTVYSVTHKRFYKNPIIASLEKGSFLKNTSRFTPKSSMTNLTVFTDTFLHDEIINETGVLADSTSQSWWLNSGGMFTIASGTGRTLHGVLPRTNMWYQRYSLSNPRDTDNGSHPQNIFRLVQINQWQNFTQEAYFKIDTLNMSDSPNRNKTNGLFLFNRYQTGDNLYYTGLRVDGGVVIKKKTHGVYYTMIYKKLFNGSAYDSLQNPNLLPLNVWIGLRSEVLTRPDQSVSIKLFTDIGRKGNWKLAAETIDDGKKYGGAAILTPGFAGIRTDFMDVQFDNYRIQKQ